MQDLLFLLIFIGQSQTSKTFIGAHTKGYHLLFTNLSQSCHHHAFSFLICHTCQKMDYFDRGEALTNTDL